MHNTYFNIFSKVIQSTGRQQAFFNARLTSGAKKNSAEWQLFFIIAETIPFVNEKPRSSPCCLCAGAARRCFCIRINDSGTGKDGDKQQRQRDKCDEQTPARFARMRIAFFRGMHKRPSFSDMLLLIRRFIAPNDCKNMKNFLNFYFVSVFSGNRGECSNFSESTKIIRKILKFISSEACKITRLSI